MEKLSDEQKLQYSRTIGLKEIGEEGQLKLLSSRVLVGGAGGLGSNALIALTALGVGTLGVVEFDKVDLSNLPRQVAYNKCDISKSKTSVIKRLLNKKNSDVIVKIHKFKLNKDNASRVIKNYDIVLDCTDNFETKFLIDDVCRKLKKPFVIAGVMGYQGQILTCIDEKDADFKSLFSELPHSNLNDDRSVYPLAVAMVTNIATSEVVKTLLNIGKHLTNSLLVIDALNNTFKTIILP